MWDEMLASRGACNVASCVMYFLNKQVAESIHKVAFYSDNRGGKIETNLQLACICTQFTQQGYERIQHNYLEKGYTQNENDSIHATIENEKKHRISVCTTAVLLIGKVCTKINSTVSC